MRALRIALAVSMLATTVQAEITPPPGLRDPRIRTVTYDPNEVIRLDGYVGYHVHLEFAPGESFVNLSAGDTGGLEVGSEGNHLFLKPKDTHVATNLTILTNKRVYTLDYHVGAKPAKGGNDAVVYLLRFTYPMDVPVLVPPEPLLTSQGRAINSDYWFCGSSSLRPLRATDDGVQTRLIFPARAEFPAVFVRNDDGSESLVNYSVEADQLVLHRVAANYVLRRGRIVGCISNHGYTGGGERLPTGTISETVERTTVGGTP